MELPAFKDLLGASKDKLKEMMAGPRARKLRALADQEMSELDIEIIKLESAIEESLIADEEYKNFSFKKLIDDCDRVLILERRKKRYTEVLAKLFPAE